MGATRRAAQLAMSRRVAQQRHVRRLSQSSESTVTSLTSSFASDVCVVAVQTRTKTVSESKAEPQRTSLCQKALRLVSGGTPLAAVFQERCVPV